MSSIYAEYLQYNVLKLVSQDSKPQFIFLKQEAI